MIHFNSNETQYRVLLEKINFWAFSVLLKFIPCILLTVLSLALIRILCDAQKRKERLLARANELSCNKLPVSNSSAGRLLRPSDASNSDFRGILPPSLTNEPKIAKKSSQVYLEMTPQSGMGNSYDSKIYAVHGSNRHASSSSFGYNMCYQFADKVSSMCCCCCCGFGFCFCIHCPRSEESKQQEIKVKVSSSTTTIFRSPSHHHHLSVASSERTTKMLIVVLLVFLICEIPAGILAFLSGILGKMFFANVSLFILKKYCSE